MNNKHSPDYMLLLKLWEPGLHADVPRVLSVVPHHFYAEVYRLETNQKSAIELPLESNGEMVRQVVGRTSRINVDACRKFVKDELELKVRGEGYSIYAIDQYQLAVIDCMNIDTQAASAYLQHGLDTLLELCQALEMILSRPFPRLEEMEDDVFRIMGIIEPYQEIYCSLKQVLGDKLSEEFKNEEVAMVYLTVANTSLAEEYKRFRAEMIQPWLDILRRALVVSQREK